MALNLLTEQIEIVTDEPTLTIFLIESKDCKKDLTIDGVEFSELKKLYGDLAENSLYLINYEKRSYVFMVDLKKLENRNMLDCHSPGKSHFDMLVGSSLTSQLVAEKYFRSEDVIKLEASETLKASLTFGQHFIAGLRIKSVTNKLGESSESKESSCSKAKDFKRKIHLKNLCSQKALEQANALVQSLIVTKSLVNAPANILNPESYEHFSLEYMERLKSLGYPVEVEIFDKSKLQNDGAGLILAVGAASQHSPRIIKLVYSPPKPEKKVCFVGKGITYDTGGLNLKPGSAMRNMKKDMGGSAAVFGIFVNSVLSNRNLHVTAYLAIAENMVSSNSARPGDVYVARNGIAVEIDNTDAEGRLVLADALTYASEEKPDLLVDIATLTGAARVALGTQVDFCMTNNLELADPILKASIETGDWVWRQPRVEIYNSGLDSRVANIENTGGRFGGAITAGMFLEKFHKSKNWLHIDTWMWTDKPNMLSKEVGATPKVVRFINELLNQISNGN